MFTPWCIPRDCQLIALSLFCHACIVFSPPLPIPSYLMSDPPGKHLLLDRITKTSTMDDVPQNRKATKEVLIQAILDSETV